MKNALAIGLCIAGIALSACAGSNQTLPPPGAATNGAAHSAALPPTTEKILHSFTGSPDGAFPYAGVIAGKHGEFYGITNGGGTVGPSGFVDGTVYEISASGNERVLYAFQGGNDGAGAEAGLVSDSSGDIFGATQVGGGSTTCSNGCGTVFELQPQSGGGFTERVIHAFAGGKDGALPLASLVLGSNGVLYGTTSFGGNAGCATSSFAGCGTVFSLTPSGSSYKEKVLYRFNGGKDGEAPRAKLSLDSKGNLYGTTEFGGNSYSRCAAGPSGNPSCGTVFELTPSGKESILYRFKGGTKDGANPRAALLAISNASFAGLTVYGGSSSSGLGTAYELTRNGSKYVERVLYFFGQASVDGARPFDADGLKADASGNLYGTTYLSTVSPCGCGTVFKLAPSGSSYTESILHVFTAAGTDGGIPYSSVTINNGVVYGTTYEGGTYCYGTSNSCGVVYKIKP
jgi:uncharacterized repeat protein (TIGR03803 family)